MNNEGLDDIDRLLGASCYVMMFVGLWFWGPLVVYILARNTRPWAAWHAFQALLIHLSVAFWLTAGVLLKVLFLVGLGMYSKQLGDLGTALGIVALVVLALVPFVLTIVGTWKAARGRVFQVPIVGRLANRFIERPAEGGA